jgi:hypothetical protein
MSEKKQSIEDGKTAAKVVKAVGEPPKKVTVKSAGLTPAVSGKKVIVKMGPEPAPRKLAKGEVPDGLAKKYFLKSTFNTSDIMHSPVEKTIQMLDKILSGERLFTM